MTAKYDNLGVEFLYPENWQLAEEDADGWPKIITINSPGGGFWSLHIYPFDADGQKLSEQVVEAMRKEYDSLEAVAAEETIAGFQTAGYDMDFYCLDAVVTARSRFVRNVSSLYLILYQAESREFESLCPVFQAVSHSLLA